MRFRVETRGSHWWFDDERRVYVRAPLTEGPRWSPPGEDWGGSDADPGLQDLVEHEYVEASITDGRLRVRQPDDWTVFAPVTPEETERVEREGWFRR